MKQIIERNYASIKKRGLITKRTHHVDFHNKLVEEVKEVKYEITNKNINLKKLGFEIADVILVGLAYAEHYNLDIERILKDKIVINENRNN